MNKFFKRFGAFLLGMIFMLVVEVGAVIGLGWYAFTGLTLENMGVTTDGKLSNGIDLGNFANYSLDNFIKYISKAQTNSDEFTLETLQDEGFDIIETLKLLNVDVDNADPSDIQSIKNINLLDVISTDYPLDYIDFGVVLAFLSNKDNNGNYSVFSESIRQVLRGNSIGELFKINTSTNTLNLFDLIKNSKVGSLLPQTFTETLEGTSYVYVCDNPALELIGNLSLELISKIAEKSEISIGKELNEGLLTELGTLKLSEFIAKLTCQTKDNYKKTLESYEDLTNKTLAEIFVKNDQDEYEFNFDVILQDIKLGNLFSMYKCSNSSNCKAHDDLLNCDGLWYHKTDDGTTITYQVVDNSTMNGMIMSNLYELTVDNLLKGQFDISLLCNGVYLGYAFGNQIANPSDASYCSVDCTHNGHTPNYLWLDSSNNEVSKLINNLSNLSLQDAMNGNLDIINTLQTLKVGELMNLVYYQNAWCEKVLCDNSGNSCPAHNGLSACDGTFVYKQVDTATLEGEINVNLYDLELSQLLNGQFSVTSVLEGAYLGKAFGFKPINKPGYCDVDCTHDNHDANYYWVNSSNKYVNDLFNQLSNESLVDVMSGSIDIETIINQVKIGSILGNLYDQTNSKWTDADGNDITTNDVMDKILYNLYDYTLSDLSSGSIQLNVLVGGIKLGEFIGYTYNTADQYWYNGNDKVSVLENVFASKLLSELTNGMSFNDIFSDIYIYQLVGHEKIDAKGTNCFEDCPNGVHYHYKDGTLVDAVNSLIDGMHLVDIINGQLNIKEKINTLYLKDVVNCQGTPLLEALQDCQIVNLSSRISTLKIGDIVKIDEKTSMGLLKSLKNVSITNLESELKTIKLGSVFGYELFSGEWKVVTYDNCTSSCPTDCDGIHKTYSDVSSLGLKLSNMTLEEFGTNGLDVSTFTLGDIYSTEQLESGIFNSLDKSKEGGGEYQLEEIPVNEIPTRLTNGLKNATCKDLQSYGIINFDEVPEGQSFSTAQALNIRFGGDSWRNFTISELLNNLIYTSIGG